MFEDVNRVLIEKEMNTFFRPAPERQQLPRTIKESFTPMAESSDPQLLTISDTDSAARFGREDYPAVSTGTGVSTAAAFAILLLKP